MSIAVEQLTGPIAHHGEVPAREVTACAFGGDRLERLFITTSRENLTHDEDRLAGSLFVCNPGVGGMPVREFAG